MQLSHLTNSARDVKNSAQKQAGQSKGEAMKPRNPQDDTTISQTIYHADSIPIESINGIGRSARARHPSFYKKVRFSEFRARDDAVTALALALWGRKKPEPAFIFG
jgi:hypothetical protein